MSYLYQVISYVDAKSMPLPSHVITSEADAKDEAKRRMIHDGARAVAVQRLTSFDSVDRVRYYRLKRNGRHLTLVACRSIDGALRAAARAVVAPYRTGNRADLCIDPDARTTCCGATATHHNETLCCKGCWRAV